MTHCFHIFILTEVAGICEQAANYLNIKGLLDIVCAVIAEEIQGKTPEQIRKHFNIKETFTPEEEDEIRRENTYHYM